LAQIAKAIIPAAGLGQRLRPITHVVPKELFPVGRHPAIEWISAEAVASGCVDIAVVINPGKQIIEEYLTTHCPDLTSKARFTFLVQPEPIGLGHALSLARNFCAGQPCAVLLPDDLIEAPRLPLRQMASVFEEKGGAVFAITQEPAANANRCGQLRLRQVGERVFKVEAILPRTASMGTGSVLLGIGRYLLSPSVLNYAATLSDELRTSELDDSAVFQYMLDIGEPVYAVHIEGTRFDISTADGYIAAWESFNGKKPI
jgi:UTP--glucose-1-phosphate uridylyltransferase